MILKNISGIVEYDGTEFHGWQIQPGLPTVQGTLEKALSQLLSGYPVRITGASRTDKGVHAKGQVFNFKACLPYSLKESLKRLNSMLPPSVAVRKLRYAPMNWHARFSARAKLYVYTIVQKKSPLERNYSWYVHEKLDPEPLNYIASIIIGKHYFGAFQKEDKRKRASTIFEAVWRKGKAGKLTFSIKGDFFLRGMVRALVGAMVSVGREKMSVGDFKKMLASGEKRLNYPMAPPEGLCLVRVYY